MSTVEAAGNLNDRESELVRRRGDGSGEECLKLEVVELAMQQLSSPDMGDDTSPVLHICAYAWVPLPT